MMACKLMVVVRTRITPEQYDQLQQLADDDCSNVSLVLRRMVTRALEQTAPGREEDGEDLADAGAGLGSALDVLLSRQCHQETR